VDELLFEVGIGGYGSSKSVGDNPILVGVVRRASKNPTGPDLELIARGLNSIGEVNYGFIDVVVIDYTRLVAPLLRRVVGGTR